MSRSLGRGARAGAPGFASTRSMRAGGDLCASALRASGAPPLARRRRRPLHKATPFTWTYRLLRPRSRSWPPVTARAKNKLEAAAIEAAEPTGPATESGEEFQADLAGMGAGASKAAAGGGLGAAGGAANGSARARAAKSVAGEVRRWPLRWPLR